MTRTSFSALLLVSVVSALIGAIVGSRATLIASASAQSPPPAETRNIPYSRDAYTPYLPGDRPYSAAAQQTPDPSSAPKLALPGGSVAAQCFHFVDQKGEVQATLALGPETGRGPTLVLLDRDGRQLYTLPPQGGVRPVNR